MACVAFASGDVLGCRQLLFKDIARPRDCLRAVFALCALGLLAGDEVLALSALRMCCYTTRQLENIKGI